MTFELGDKIWFMVDGILPVQGVVTSKHLSRDEYVILVRSPECLRLFRYYCADSKTIFKSLDDLKNHYCGWLQK